MKHFSDIVAILDWVEKQKKPESKLKAPPKKLDLEDMDLAEVYLKLKAKENKIKDAIAQVEKMAKKEEKKDEKKDEKKGGLGISHINMLLIWSFPIIGPLYYMWLKSLIN
jgi:hypothetical protein